MTQVRHPFLEIPKKSFADGSLPKIFTQKLTLPKKVFPPTIRIEKENYFCGGYFISYEKIFSNEELAQICKARNWGFLVNLAADFLIIYCDYSTNELFVITDQTGKFPCYFSTAGDFLILSTNFGAVKNALDSATLNLDTAFDYLATGLALFPTDETFISEIRQLPPGCLLRIDSSLSFSVESMVDLDGFIARKESPYTTLKEFSDDFLILLGQIVKERLDRVGSLRFAADLSSGFDSSLISYLLKGVSKKSFTCYCGFCQKVTVDTNPRIVAEFAKKHGLRVKFFNEDNYFPLSKASSLKATTVEPSRLILEERERERFERAAKDSNVALFQGSGGDELYDSHLLEFWVSFPIQQNYFVTVGRLNLGIGKILSKNGLALLLDRQRFVRKKFYPLIISESAVGLNLALFPLAWETGVWPITPYIDWRVVEFARRILLKDSKAPGKQEIWKHHGEIFVPGQFKPKEGYENLGRLYLLKKPDLVISILRDSILGKKGLVKAQEVVADIKKRNLKKYLEADEIIYLLYLLRLEYFLQQNNVKVKQ